MAHMPDDEPIIITGGSLNLEIPNRAPVTMQEPSPNNPRYNLISGMHGDRIKRIVVIECDRSGVEQSIHLDFKPPEGCCKVKIYFDHE